MTCENGGLQNSCHQQNIIQYFNSIILKFWRYIITATFQQKKTYLHPIILNITVNSSPSSLQTNINLTNVIYKLIISNLLSSCSVSQLQAEHLRPEIIITRDEIPTRLFYSQNKIWNLIKLSSICFSILTWIWRSVSDIPLIIKCNKFDFLLQSCRVSDLLNSKVKSVSCIFFPEILILSCPTAVN